MNAWIFSSNPRRYDLHARIAAARLSSFSWQIGSTQYLLDIGVGDPMALNEVGGVASGQLLGHGVIAGDPFEETVGPNWISPHDHWQDPADVGKTLWFVDVHFTWLATPVPYADLKADPDFARSLFIRSGGRSNPTPADPDDWAALYRLIAAAQGAPVGGP